MLEEIKGPEDIKKIPLKSLGDLAKEVRNLIIDVVSKNGGHLAPSLGVVELTIALLYTLDPPRDKILWDVGHQSYAYKILTGRLDKFHTLRTFGGISGFPNRFESPFDPLTTGHSGTSISTALGIKEALIKEGRPYRVVAVIGDGSLGSGVALEGLNNAGHLDRDLLIILNDNEMSISKNVGAMSAYLNRIMTGKWVNRVREEIKRLVSLFPGSFGNQLSRMVKYMEETIKGAFTPGIIFEELGIKYFGPVDGHNLGNLIPTIKNVLEWKGPVLLHVITKKGKGYEPAEKRPELFHGTGPFERETGKPLSRCEIPTYTEIFGKTLVELARENKKIVAITAAMKKGTGLSEFSETFPDRFYDVGIAEQHAVSFAAGLAEEGYTPVVAIYSTFLQRALDQIIQDVCLQNFHVVFAIDRAGLVGEDGPTHHGAFDLSYLRFIPNMVIMAPKDEGELRDMLYTAINYGGPISIRYPKGKGVGAPIKEPKEIPIGKAEILKEGGELLVITAGSPTHACIEATYNMDNITLVNARFIKPLDVGTLVSFAKKIKKVLVVEDNSKIGGLGSAVLEALVPELGSMEFHHIAIPDKFITHGDLLTLRKTVGLDRESIRKTIDRILSGGRKSVV